jgi:hypothetical protein
VETQLASQTGTGPAGERQPGALQPGALQDVTEPRGGASVRSGQLRERLGERATQLSVPQMKRRTVRWITTP